MRKVFSHGDMVSNLKPVVFVVAFISVVVFLAIGYYLNNNSSVEGELFRLTTVAQQDLQPPKFTPLVTSKTISAEANRFVTFGKSFDDGRGLGNQLFDFATMLFVAEVTNRQPAIFNLSYVTEVEKAFNVQVPRFEEEFLCPCDKIGESNSLSYDKKFEDIAKSDSYNRTIWILGFFQSWKYLRSIRHRMEQNLVFKPEIEAFVRKFLNDNIPSTWTKGFIRVGIHARRGDVLTEDKIKFGYTTPDEHYFRRAMAHFVQNYDTPVQFIVASGDIPWCRQHFDRIVENFNKDGRFHHNVTYSVDHSAGEDLALLASCDHVIMSTGTYGWWAAWLAKGTTIYYSNWPRNGSSLASKFVRQDFFPPWWIDMI